jgi:GT2 family glycosyltransferase
MAPRSFRQYWSGRAWVAELIDAGRWSWEGDAPATAGEAAVEVWAGLFSHLDDIRPSLARGAVAVMSQDVADGLGLCHQVPDALVFGGDPNAEEIARCLSRIATLSPGELDALRLAQCEAVIRSGQGPEWEARLDGTADALDRLAVVGSRKGPSLSRILRRQCDPRIAMADVATFPAVAETSSAPATLTAVVTCYGMGELARQTVTSVWASTRRPDELIIIDDGSRDKATQSALEAICADATQRGLPLQVLRQHNQGLASARNAALAAATGTFISFIDGDDLVEPAFYELAVALLEREPGVGAVSAWAELFGDGVPDGFWNAPQPELPLLLIENQVIVPAVTRTALLRSLGGYDARQLYNYEDWELSVRYLARGHPIVTIPRYLHRYRVRAESMYRSMNPAQHVLMRERFLDTHHDVAESFALEVALQLEHRLWQRIQADVAREGASENPSPGTADGPAAAVVSREGRLPLMRRARQAVLRTVNSLRRALGT